MTTTIHLCDTCIYENPNCPAIYGDLTFSNGWGNDNICGCKIYERKRDI